MSKHRLYTKMLRIHLFSIFTIKGSRVLAALAPLCLFTLLNREDADKCTLLHTRTYPEIVFSPLTGDLLYSRHQVISHVTVDFLT